MDKDFERKTYDEILDEYSDVVEELKVSEYYSNDEAIALLIKMAVYAGIDMNRHDNILDLIVMVHGRRYRGGKVDFKTSNYDLMIKIIKEKPYLLDDNKFPYDKNYNDMYYYDGDYGDYDESWGPVEGNDSEIKKLIRLD